jgi:hypothetical protein
MRGPTDDRIRTEQPARGCRREVVLANVRARRARQERNIYAIVDDDARAIGTRRLDEPSGVVEERSGRKMLGAQLDDTCAAVEKCVRQPLDRPAGTGGSVDVQNGV